MRLKLKVYSSFFTLTLLFILMGLIGMLFLDKGEATLSLNGWHSPVLDVIFRYVTWMGEWMGAIAVGLFLLLLKPLKYVFIYIVAIALAFGSAQTLKRAVFSQNNRPALEYQEQLHQVNGVKLNKKYSFPSGHTTGAFSIFSILAFALIKRRWQIGAALTASAVGISRMYLGQHFLMDVVAGACLGTLVATLVFFYLEPRLIKKAWNKRLIRNQ